MVKTEQAFDMLPYVVDIFEKLDLKSVGEKLTKDIKRKHPEMKDAELRGAVGQAAVMYVLKHSPKVKNEFFSIVAIACGVSVDDAKAQPVATSIRTFQTVFSDAELLAFFKDAMQ